MYDDIRRHFENGVVGAYNDYLDIKLSPSTGVDSDLRRAIEAATRLYHFGEFLDKANRRQAFDSCPDYGLLGEVTNATKHGEITRGNPRFVKSASQIVELSCVTLYTDTEGTYSHCEKLVAIELGPGKYRDLLEVLTSVLNYWESTLKPLRGRETARTWKYPLHEEPRLRSQSNGGRLDLLIKRELGVSQRVQVLRFDYASGRVVPVDLTGWDARARIHAPHKEMRAEIEPHAEEKEAEQG